MELLPNRDLVKDEYGNYYTITQVDNESVVLVNYFMKLTFNRILNDDTVAELRGKYDKSVAVGQFFQDSVKNKIEGLKTGRYPGGIYPLSEVAEKYKVYFDPTYERDVNA